MLPLEGYNIYWEGKIFLRKLCRYKKNNHQVKTFTRGDGQQVGGSPLNFYGRSIYNDGVENKITVPKGKKFFSATNAKYLWFLFGRKICLPTRDISPIKAA